MNEKNPWNNYADPRVQHLSDLWWNQRQDMDLGALERNHNAYSLYLKHILGKGEKPNNFGKFWTEVTKLWPDKYTIGDLEFLIEKCSDKVSVDYMVLQLGYNIHDDISELAA